MAESNPGKKAAHRKGTNGAMTPRGGGESVMAKLEAELERVKLQNKQLTDEVKAAKEAETAALERCQDLEEQLKTASSKANSDMVTLLFKDLHSTKIEKAKAEHAFQGLLRDFFELRTAKARAENAHQKLVKQVKDLKSQVQQQVKEVEKPPAGKGKGKRELSVLKLVSELKRVKASAERAEGELQKLREEKERVEESQDMIALQTQALLQERQWLMSKMEQKDADARNLQQEMDKVMHELRLVAGDREVLLTQLNQMAGLEHLSPEMLLDDSPATLMKHMRRSDDDGYDSEYTCDLTCAGDMSCSEESSPVLPAPPLKEPCISP